MNELNNPQKNRQSSINFEQRGVIDRSYDFANPLFRHRLNFVHHNLG